MVWLAFSAFAGHAPA
jgi:hypothetical protein